MKKKKSGFLALVTDIQILNCGERKESDDTIE